MSSLPSLPKTGVATSLEPFEKHAVALRERIARYESFIEQAKRAIEIADLKLRTVMQLIDLEQQSPEFGPSNSFTLAQAAEGSDGSVPEAAGVRLGRSLTKQWYEFVEKRLHEFGPSTVDALFAEADLDWREAFQSVTSTSTPLFRARRSLRRSPNFEVDRTTGLVTMTGSAAPPIPSFQNGDPIVTNVIVESNERIVYFQTGNQTYKQRYFDFKERLNHGERLWMQDPVHGLLPLAIKLLMKKHSQLSSFDEEDWTSNWYDFANLAQKLPPPVMSPQPLLRRKAIIP